MDNDTDTNSEKHSPQSPENEHQRPTSDMSWLAKSWVGRHWRGDLSLPVSYWLNGLIGNIAILLIASLVAAWLADYSPLPGFIGLSSMWGFALLITVWQIVGTWRSSNQHVERGGKAFWAGLAKVMLVLAVIQNYGIYSRNAWPQIKEAYNILMGDSRVGSITLRLLNAGTEIEVSGGISFGSTAELQKLLDAAPAIRTVHLNSRGGRIAEAFKMRKLIHDRALITVTNADCVSACTIAFLGGVERYLHPITGRLGFHRGSFPGVDESDIITVSNEIIDDAVQSGVSRDFMNKAYSTANTSMWYPTRNELLSSRYVTALSQGQFAISGFGDDPNESDIASILHETPIYAAVEQAEPAVFREMLQIFAEGVVYGRPEGDVYARIRGLLSNLIVKYLPQASDDAIIEMMNVLIDEMTVVSKVDPISCHSFIFPEQDDHFDLRRFADKELLDRDLSASEKVLLTGMQGQEPMPTETEMTPLLEKLLLQIVKGYGQHLLSEIADLGPNSPRQKSCALSIILYSEIIKMPRSEATKLFRYMMSEGL